MICHSGKWSRALYFELVVPGTTPDGEGYIDGDAE